MSSKIIAGTTAGTALNMSADTTGILEIQTGSTPTTAITVDASQNVGIGIASPSVKLQAVGAIKSSNSGDTVSTRLENDGVYATGTDLYLVAPASKFMSFYANSAERMRIDTSGNLLVGTTSSLANGLTVTGGGGPQFSLNTTTRFTQFNFYNSGSQKGFIAFDNDVTRLIIQNASAGVYLSSGATSWTSNSDERNKDIIEPITDAVNKVSTLRTIIGKYKTDGKDKRRAFLIAQDVEKVFPEAVEASNPDDLGVNYTDVIPLLTAAIKEQQVMIEELKTKVAALEAK